MPCRSLGVTDTCASPVSRRMFATPLLELSILALRKFNAIALRASWVYRRPIMKLVTTCLELAAAETPRNPAIIYKGVLLSYRELASLAHGVTRGLERAGVAPGDRVAVLMSKSEAAVACIYGVLGLGCSYVPIDPNTPAQRV